MPINTALAEKVFYRYSYLRDNGHQQYTEKANTCEAFFRGDQWSAADVQALRESRRPALTINKIISTIGNVMGEQIYNRSEISFRPKSGADPQTADILTKVFKQISDNNQLDWRRSDMFTDGIITSRGYLDVRMDFSESIKGEVRIESINPKNVIVDNDAEEHDPDKWGEVFTTKWVTADDVAVLYSKSDAELLRNREQSYFPYGFDSIDYVRDRFGLPFDTSIGSGQSYDMSPVIRSVRVLDRQHRVLDRQKYFIDPKTGSERPVPEGWDRNRIAMVCSQFGYEVISKLNRRIRWTVISDNVVLHDDWSPYKHFTIVPYFPYFRHGHTIGLVENLVGPQELLNKVSSQELHAVNSSANGGYKIKTGALATMSVEELEQRGAETGLVIEMTGALDEIEKLLPNATPQGLDRISYKAEEHIKTISGVSDSQQGMDREDVAAKAIQTKKQAASTNMAKPLDSLVRTDFMIARNVLDLIQTFYTEEQILTITHNRAGGGTEDITINKTDPETGEVLNDLTLGEYDVTISSVPQRETLEDSQFDQAVSMKKDLGMDIPDEFIINASRLLNKNDLIKQMAAKTQSPEAVAAQQLQVRGNTAEVEKTESEVAQHQADAKLKDAKAGKDTVTAQKDAQTPIEGPQEESQAEMMKVQADIQLKREEFEFKKEIGLQELELKRQETQQKQQLAVQAQAQKAVADRIAANKPKTPSTAA